jgi:TolA-binding protein
MIKKITFSLIIAVAVFMTATKCSAEMASDIGQAQKNICNTMDTGNYESARSATDKLIADFNNHQDLPEAIYWTIRHCEWTGKYDEAKRLCQQLIQKYPDNPFTDKARLSIARSKVMALVMSGEYDLARTNMNKMVADFPGNPDLPESLYMVAEKCEWKRQFEQQKLIYRMIIQNHTASPFAIKAQIGIARAEILSYIIEKDYARFDNILDKLFTNYAGNEQLPQTVIIIGEWFYKEGLSQEKEGLKDQAKANFEKAVKIWNRVIKELPDSELITEASYWAGGCYLKLGEYLKAAEAFGNTYQGNPEYKYADYCLFAQADCYEKAKVTQTDIAITTEQIKDIYRKLITKYPKSDYAFKAALRLDDLQNETK